MSTDKYVAAVTLQTKSGIKKDYVRNVWAFAGGSGSDLDDAAAINSHLATFYGAMANWSKELNAGATVDVYKVDLVTGKLSTPFTSSWHAAMVTVGANAPLPSEVACCLSIHGSLAGLVERAGTTRPAARHRGRLYLGPWDSNWCSQDATTFRPSASTLANVINGAATTLMGATDVTWSVWSRTNKAFYPVSGGFVDNEWDTQRRRGTQATARVTFGA